MLGEELGDNGGCVRCPAGSASFGNSASCADCADVPGLVCHGGADFEVEAGYWLSQSAAACTPDDNALQCLKDRMYECSRAVRRCRLNTSG